METSFESTNGKPPTIKVIGKEQNPDLCWANLFEKHDPAKPCRF